ncbi:MAG: polymer-forming cytoskeletal protein [Bryobacteraceae bacterium]
MWNDRKPQEDSPRTAPAVSKLENPVAEPRVERAGPVATAESQGVTVITKSMVIKGQIRSAEHMNIAGEIEGSLDLAGFDLTVTGNAKVRANVSAREVDSGGVIQGNVNATRKITVRTGGKLIGDLRTPGIVIEDGAYFKGNIEIVTRDRRQEEMDAEPPLAKTATANS